MNYGNRPCDCKLHRMKRKVWSFSRNWFKIAGKSGTFSNLISKAPRALITQNTLTPDSDWFYYSRIFLSIQGGDVGVAHGLRSLRGLFFAGCMFRHRGTAFLVQRHQVWTLRELQLVHGRWKEQKYDGRFSRTLTNKALRALDTCSLWFRTTWCPSINHSLSHGLRSEWASERLSAAEHASEESRAEESKEWAVRANERVAQHLRQDYWLFWTIVRSCPTNNNLLLLGYFLAILSTWTSLV